MRLIAAILMMIASGAAFAMYQQNQQDQQPVDGGGDTPPDTLPPQSLLEGMGIVTGNQTRGERNNNPGNIRKSSANWQGKIAGGDLSFETFATPQDGIRAIGVVLKNYQQKYGLNTVQGIISRWAPVTENNTADYIKNVAASIGVSPTQQIDLNNPNTLSGIVTAIIAHENGRVVYASSTIAAGISLA